MLAIIPVKQYHTLSTKQPSSDSLSAICISVSQQVYNQMVFLHSWVFEIPKIAFTQLKWDDTCQVFEKIQLWAFIPNSTVYLKPSGYSLNVHDDGKYNYQSTDG